MNNVLDLRKAFNVPNIIESICNWNADRYEQEYNHELTCALIYEEVSETELAINNDDMVEIADGYADIFYVAIGALWKSGGTPSDIGNILDDIEDIMPVPPVSVCLAWLEKDVSVSIPVLAMTALSAFGELSKLLNSDDAALDVIRAVCNSNNTKIAVKTEADTKANIDKGASYVPPTKDIEKILNLVAKGVYKVSG